MDMSNSASGSNTLNFDDIVGVTLSEEMQWKNIGEPLGNALIVDKGERKEPKCWPLTKFWEHLVIFDHFWDFDNLSKMEHQTKQRLQNLGPLLGPFLGFGNM
jgi:hypothetical protein